MRIKNCQICFNWILFYYRNIWVPLQTFLNEELNSLNFNGDKSVNYLEALKFASEVVGLNTFNSKIFIILTEKDIQVYKKYSVFYICMFFKCI